MFFFRTHRKTFSVRFGASVFDISSEKNNGETPTAATAAGVDNERQEDAIFHANTVNTRGTLNTDGHDSQLHFDP